MNNDPPQLPRHVPEWLKYLLALPADASRAELENEWQTFVVPLVARGPAHLWDLEITRLMTSGLPASKCERAFGATRYGQKLKNSIEREGRIRARAAAHPSKPPFAK